MEDVTITCGSGWEKLYRPLVEKCWAAGVKVERIEQRAGGLRIFVDTCAAEELLWAEIDAAEAMSFVFCEHCGTEQDVTTDGHDYVRTLCKPCRTVHEQAIAN